MKDWLSVHIFETKKYARKIQRQLREQGYRTKLTVTRIFNDTTWYEIHIKDKA